jgi:hypothetical protein
VIGASRSCPCRGARVTDSMPVARSPVRPMSSVRVRARCSASRRCARSVLRHAHGKPGPAHQHPHLRRDERNTAACPADCRHPPARLHNGAHPRFDQRPITTPRPSIAARFEPPDGDGGRRWRSPRCGRARASIAEVEAHGSSTRSRTLHVHRISMRAPNFCACVWSPPREHLTGVPAEVISTRTRAACPPRHAVDDQHREALRPGVRARVPRTGAGNDGVIHSILGACVSVPACARLALGRLRSCPSGQMAAAVPGSGA